MKIVGGKEIFSIAEVNSLGKQTLEQIAIWVEGEISSFQQNPAWFNVFLNLSDGTNILECFTKPTNIQSFQSPLEGQKVVAFGRPYTFQEKSVQNGNLLHQADR